MDGLFRAEKEPPLAMDNDGLDYQPSNPRAKSTGLLSGSISLAFAVAVFPLRWATAIVVILLLAAAFCSGIYSEITSQGQSVLGWIGLGLCLFYLWCIAMVIGHRIF